MKLRMSIAMILLLCTLSNGPAIGKEWTIEERQNQLMKDVNAGQKAKALTDKEAKKLRGDLADVARRKKKLETKTKGALSAKDKAKLESDLNDISVEIKKLQLEKRVESK